MNSIEIIIKHIPKSPWVYQFLNENWKIIYIWKSINLFSRVNSYFNWKGKLNFAKKKMVSEIKNIETIVVNNEKESLILETTFIKKHKPKYNILMKDDKNHLYISITNEEIPKIIKTRIKPPYNSPLAEWEYKWLYFWPYISSNHVNNILKIIKKLFWYRSCQIEFIFPVIPMKTGISCNTNTPPIILSDWKESKDPLNNNNLLIQDIRDSSFISEWQQQTKLNIKSSHWTKIPCIDYYTKRCSWPCLLWKNEINEYKNAINSIKLFLNWDFKDVIKNLERKMKDKAKELKFEEAMDIKNDIESIKSLDETQIVRDFVEWNYEVINYIEKYDSFFIWIVSIVDSKVVDFRNYEIETHLEETIEEILEEFIEREIVAKSPYPSLQRGQEKTTILLPIEINPNIISRKTWIYWKTNIHPVILSDWKELKDPLNNDNLLIQSKITTTHFYKEGKDSSFHSEWQHRINEANISNIFNDSWSSQEWQENKTIKDLESKIQYLYEVPKIWPKAEILKLAYKNVYNYAYNKHLSSLSTKSFTKQTMKNLLDILWYKQINKDIIFECNDISHLSWSHTVASRSIIENWKPNTSKYKKFNIKTLENLKIDDFWSMKEIMERRLKEMINIWNIPDLIIIDWWIGQLNSVIKVVDEYKNSISSWTCFRIFNNLWNNLDDSCIKTFVEQKDSEINSEWQQLSITLYSLLSKLQIVSIAKREEELFLPWVKDPIVLEKDTQELRLVQKIRDEAHRFAITFNREKRLKSEKKNLLESIPWIWPKTRAKLTKTYWNIDNLKWVAKEDLEKIISKSQLEALENHGII